MMPLLLKDRRLHSLCQREFRPLHQRADTGMGLTFREMTPDELKRPEVATQYLALFTEALPQYRHLVGGVPIQTVLEAMIGLCLSEMGRLYGLYTEGVLVGYVLAKRSPYFCREKIEIESVYGRRGIETRAFSRWVQTRLEAWANEVGAICIEGETVAPPRHWHRLGYQTIAYVVRKYLSPREEQTHG